MPALPPKRILARAILSWVLVLPLGAASIDPDAKVFIDKHCAECHDAETKKGGLDLTSLNYSPEDKANFGTWVKVHDRVEAGEMPPKKKPRPEAATLGAFLKGMNSQLTASEKAIVARDGRAMQRRLNRYEYENVLRDLLNVPWAQIRNRLPEDGEAHRYNKSGESLDVSHVQMARYMSVSDYAMRQAMSAQLERPPTTTNRFYARNEPSLIGNFRPRENGTLPDRHSFPVLDSHAQPDVRAGRAPISEPATKEREAVLCTQGNRGTRWCFRASPLRGWLRSVGSCCREVGMGGSVQTIVVPVHFTGLPSEKCRRPTQSDSVISGMLPRFLSPLLVPATFAHASLKRFEAGL